MTSKPTRFTIRVYGILQNARGQVLLSSEKISDFSFTKFPGGGLELGEGLEDCLKREFQEEMGLAIQVGQVLFVTPDLVQSQFNASLQVICLYYEVSLADEATAMPEAFEAKIHPFEKTYNTVRLFWQGPDEVASALTFETDKMAWLHIADSILP